YGWDRRDVRATGRASRHPRHAGRVRFFTIGRLLTPGDDPELQTPLDLVVLRTERPAQLERPLNRKARLRRMDAEPDVGSFSREDYGAGARSAIESSARVVLSQTPLHLAILDHRVDDVRAVERNGVVLRVVQTVIHEPRARWDKDHCVMNLLRAGRLAQDGQ